MAYGNQYVVVVSTVPTASAAPSSTLSRFIVRNFGSFRFYTRSTHENSAKFRGANREDQIECKRHCDVEFCCCIGAREAEFQSNISLRDSLPQRRRCEIHSGECSPSCIWSFLRLEPKNESVWRVCSISSLGSSDLSDHERCREAIDNHNRKIQLGTELLRSATQFCNSSCSERVEEFNFTFSFNAHEEEGMRLTPQLHACASVLVLTERRRKRSHRNEMIALKGVFRIIPTTLHYCDELKH
jgi:hypothetical protein